jgi:hypothetical protein
MGAQLQQSLFVRLQACAGENVEREAKRVRRVTKYVQEGQKGVHAALPSFVREGQGHAHKGKHLGRLQSEAHRMTHGENAWRGRTDGGGGGGLGRHSRRLHGLGGH